MIFLLWNLNLLHSLIWYGSRLEETHVLFDVPFENFQLSAPCWSHFSIQMFVRRVVTQPSKTLKFCWAEIFWSFAIASFLLVIIIRNLELFLELFACFGILISIIYENEGLRWRYYVIVITLSMLWTRLNRLRVYLSKLEVYHASLKIVCWIKPDFRRICSMILRFIE